MASIGQSLQESEAAMAGAFRRVDVRSDGRSVFRYRSAALGDDLEVTVVPPPLETGRPAPAIYVLDPFFTLDIVVGCSNLYGRDSGGEVPAAFRIGIGHATADEGELTVLRIRDFTPTPVTGRDWRPPRGAGRGPALLSAISDEIIPFVEASFPVSNDRTIIGWSLGGLFALYALFHRPGLFTRTLAVSPSLWWENRLPMDWERTWAAGHKDLPARLFMSVGEHEQAPGGGWRSEGFSDDIIAWFSQVTNFLTFTEQLRAREYPGLRFDSTIFADEYHLTVFPAAVARGLVSLFDSAKG